MSTGSITHGVYTRVIFLCKTPLYGVSVHLLNILSTLRNE